MIIQPSFSQFFQCSNQLGSAYELSSRVKKKQNVSLVDINHNVTLITFSLNRPRTLTRCRPDPFVSYICPYTLVVVSGALPLTHLIPPSVCSAFLRKSLPEFTLNLLIFCHLKARLPNTTAHA